VDELTQGMAMWAAHAAGQKILNDLADAGQGLVVILNLTKHFNIDVEANDLKRAGVRVVDALEAFIEAHLLAENAAEFEDVRQQLASLRKEFLDG
jgi:acetate kinase